MSGGQQKQEKGHNGLQNMQPEKNQENKAAKEALMNLQAAALNFEPHLHLPRAAFRIGRLSIFSEPILWAEPQKPEPEKHEEQA